MSQAVVIKSNKYGINLVLDKTMPFRELLVAIKEKFLESEKFFKDAKMAISFEGRELTQEEEYQIIETITENTSISIDRKSTRLNSSHPLSSRMPSSA